MDEQEREILELEFQIRAWQAWKNPPGTKIHYARLKIERLKKAPKKVPKAPKPVKPKVKKDPPPPQAKPCPENRAFVLRQEVYDLTQAMVALERLR